MTLHTCRDFLETGVTLSNSSWVYAQYLTAIFLIGTLNYVIVGQTNFNLASATYLKASGNTASINQGGNDVYAVAVPAGTYVVSAADISRILVLKSPGNGMVNSGLFRITGINTTNNWFYINYRSGNVPPVESGVQWSVYENELVFYGNVNYTGNGSSTGYTGQGTATQSRIILQSPSSISWQVRIAFENSVDTGANGTSPSSGFSAGATMTVGYGGTVAGDFTPGGQHTHGPLFFNNRGGVAGNYSLLGTSVGFFPADNQCRHYYWGDDSTGSFFGAARPVVPTVSTFSNGSMVHFGLPEDEELPLPPHNAQRLFVMGANTLTNGGNNGIYFQGDPPAGRGGMAFGLSNQPISCIYSLYNPLFGNTFGGTSGNNPARSSLNAGDNQYTASTELLPVDLVAGTMDYMNGYGFNAEILILEGRRLGRAPFLRMGRTNYGYFQVSTDPNNSWLHLNDGIYLPWQGAILP